MISMTGSAHIGPIFGHPEGDLRSIGARTDRKCPRLWAPIGVDHENRCQPPICFAPAQGITEESCSDPIFPYWLLASVRDGVNRYSEEPARLRSASVTSNAMAAFPQSAP